MTQEIKPQDHPDFVGGWVWNALEIRSIEKYIAEAVIKEREACAKVCDELFESSRPVSDESGDWVLGTKDCAEAIRARGKV